jgi:hypothetical protein
MTLEHAYYLSQIVAALAVIGSLLYLGRQVNQTNKQARAQTRQAMMALAQAEITQFQNDPSIFATFTKEEPSWEDKVKLSQWLSAAMRAREFEWFAHKNGTIDDDMFKAYSGMIPIILGTERTRRWWAFRKDLGEFDPAFSTFVDSLLARSPFTEFWSSIDKW